MPSGGVKPYARWRAERGLDGGTPPAVRKAIATGRISRDANGDIDFEHADRDWAARTDPLRGKPLGAKPVRVTPKVVRKPKVAKAVLPPKPTPAAAPVAAAPVPPAPVSPAPASPAPKRKLAAPAATAPVSSAGPVAASISSRRTQGSDPEPGDGGAGDVSPEDSSEEPESGEPAPPALVDPTDMQASRAAREYWNAKKAQIEYEEKAGELLPTSDVKRMVFSVGRMHAAAREQAPGQLAPMLVGLIDPLEIERVIRELLRELDLRTTREIESRYGDLLMTKQIEVTDEAA